MSSAGLVQRRPAPVANASNPPKDADEDENHRPVAVTTHTAKARPPPLKRTKSKAEEKVDAEVQQTIEQFAFLGAILTLLLLSTVGFAFWMNQRLVMDKLVREEMDLRAALLEAHPGANIDKIIAEAPVLERKPYRPGMHPVGGGNYEEGWYGTLPKDTVNAIKLRQVRKKLADEKAKVASEIGIEEAEAREKAYRAEWVREMKERDSRHFLGRERPNAAAVYGEDAAAGSGTPSKPKSGGGKASSERAAGDVSDEVRKLREELDRLKEELKNQQAGG